MFNVEVLPGHCRWTLENFREPVWQFSIIQHWIAQPSLAAGNETTKTDGNIFCPINCSIKI